MANWSVKWTSDKSLDRNIIKHSTILTFLGIVSPTEANSKGFVELDSAIAAK